MANAEPPRDAEVMDFDVKDGSLVENETSSFIAPILAVDIKVESSVSTEDGISETEKYKQTFHCNEQESETCMLDTKPIINEVKVEKNPLSVKNETSLMNPLDFLALVEEQNEVSSDNEVYETGDFSDLFPEQGQTPRTVNLNPVNVSSPADCTSSCRDPCTETHLIVKEEEEWNSKEAEVLHESNSQPLPKTGPLFKGDESNQSAASYGKVSVRPVWELCEEGFYKSPSTAVGDEPLSMSEKPLGESQKSRAYYYSHGYKLAHVSIVLEDLKTHATSYMTEKPLPSTIFSPNFSDASGSNYLKTEDQPRLITHTGEEPSPSAYCLSNFSVMSALNRDSQTENEFHRTTHTTEEAFSCSYLPEFVHANGSNTSRFEDKSYPVTQTVEEPFSQAYFPPNFSHASGSDGYSSISHPNSHPFEEPFSQAYCPPNFSHINGSHSRMQDGSHPSTHPFEEPYSRTYCSPESHHGSNGYWLPNNVTVESSDDIPHPHEEPFSQTYHTPKFSLRDKLNVNFKRLLTKQPEEMNENVNCQRLIEKPPEERNQNVNCKRSVEKQPEETNKIVNCKRSTKKPRLEIIKNVNFKRSITNQPEEINKNVNFKHFSIKQPEETEDLPHSCAYCSAKFSQNGTLISHFKIHTSAEPFSCLYCHVRFDDNSALKSHLRVHT